MPFRKYDVGLACADTDDEEDEEDDEVEEVAEEVKRAAPEVEVVMVVVVVVGAEAARDGRGREALARSRAFNSAVLNGNGHTTVGRGGVVVVPPCSFVGKETPGVGPAPVSTAAMAAVAAATAIAAVAWDSFRLVAHIGGGGEPGGRWDADDG